MIGVLTDDQIDQVLNMHMFGRIACYADKQLYIVPVSYAFDGKFLYAHSREGMKVHMLRKNPQACFQVDAIEGPRHWRSVVVWGEYEEIGAGAGLTKAQKLLRDKFEPFHMTETLDLPEPNSRPPHVVEKRRNAVYFRIKITKKTGRFEKP